jgi:putative heme-binding domain-containing protein
LVDFLRGIRGHDEFTALVARFQVAECYADLVDTAAGNHRQAAVDALQALVALGQQKLVAERLSSWSREMPEKFESLASTLSASQTPAAVDLLFEFAANRQHDIESRRQAVRALGRIPQGSHKLLQWARQTSYDPALEPAVVAALSTSGSSEIKTQMREVFPASPDESARAIPDIQALLKLTGDPQRGRLVFNTESAQCAKCHLVQGAGQSVGPDLSEIGGKLAAEALFESLLFPSAGISHNYENWKVLTIDGQTLHGLLVSRTDAEIQIKNAEGVVRVIAAGEVEELQTSPVSLMPDGVHEQLSDQQLADLVAYLLTLKGR